MSYVLFERQSQQHFHASDQQWQCCAFGSYADVMDWVFAAACIFWQGYRQTNAGYRLPEEYLQEWACAFSTPFLMSDRTVRLWVGNGPYDPVAPADLVAASLLLAGLGRSNAYRVLEDSILACSLYEETDVLRAPFGYGRLPPWRIFPRLEPPGPVDCRLAPERATHRVTLPYWQVLKVGRDDLVRIEAGPFGSGLWQFLCLPQFVRGVAYRIEMASPGMGTAALRSYVNTRAEAKSLPSTSRLAVLRLSMDCSVQQIATVDHIAQVVGIAGIREQAPRLCFMTMLRPCNLDSSPCSAHWRLASWSGRSTVKTAATRQRRTAVTSSIGT